MATAAAEPSHTLTTVPPHDPNRLYCTTGAAYVLGVTSKSIERYRRQGRFPEPTHYVGKRPRWTLSSLLTFARALPAEEVRRGR